ncbi:MAG: DUF1326 domain-containing protein [Planctomycetia bacterium]|nr:DUF1326 domain-containing protein [Planctomycetia bacterium]
MKLRFVLPVLALAAALTGCASNGGTADTSGKPGAFHVRGMQVEACECESVCPCVFEEDATYDMCQGWIALSVEEGSFEGTDLAGVKCAVALVKTEKNLAKSLGKWEGRVWIDEGASEAQRKGITAVVQASLGGAFAKLEFKTAKVTIASKDGKWELAVAGVGEARITPIKTKEGKVLAVVNSPSPIIMPEYNCCIAESNTFSDGGVKWDFKGRNGGYGGFEFKSK